MAGNALEVNATVSATTQAYATAAAPSYSEGTLNNLSMDLAGGLRITGTINASSSMHATAAAPSYVEGSDDALSSNLTGDLRTIAKQNGTWTVGLSSGSNLVGKVGIDQTTPGTTNAVDVTNWPVAVDVNSGVKSNSTPRFVLATDQPQLTNALKVDGSAVTQPVSGTVTANLGTIAGAATAAKQPALGTAGTASTDVITIQGIASMTKLLVTPDANSAVNVAQINGVTPLMGNGATGTGSHRVTIANDSTAIAGWGQGATGAAVPAGAQYKGLIASTANPSAATAGNLVGAMSDKVGRQAVVPYQVRDLVGQQTTTITASTSETTIVTAVASTFLDVLSFNFTNSGSTATRVDIRDTTGGSVVAVFFVPATDMRGQTYTVPFKQTTVNTNWTAQCSASTSSLYCTVQYVKNI